MSNNAPRKRFGQNFLSDKNIINKIIASLAPSPADHIVEIGPGQAAITKPLSEVVENLDLIEIDRDLAGELQTRSWTHQVRVFQGDALEFDFRTLILGNEKLRLVGNLPYNISTPLLFHFLDAAEIFSDMHVMLQKEVVDRMTAAPGSKTYGRLTAMLAARCNVEHLFNISPGCFNPAPKVDSSFARLIPHQSPLVPEEYYARYKIVVTQAFSMRRKTLGNALRNVMEPAKIRAAGIDPSLRAEVLHPEQFLELARQLS